MIKIKASAQAVLCLVWYCLSTALLAAPPEIVPIPQQQVALGSTLSVTPQLANMSPAEVNWSIAYGPDEAEVIQGTGEVRWQVPGNQASESYYIGLRATTTDGSDIRYFIVHAGVPQVVQVGPSHPIKSLAEALRAFQSPGNQFRQAGTTFVVENGTYSSDDFMIGLTGNGVVQMPPAGNSSRYTTVMAETPGGVELNGNAKIALQGGTGNPQYMAIKGFFINGTNLDVTGQRCNEDASCFPHHIKFVANGIYLVNGQGFGASYARDLLFENNYAFGGLRTKVSFFKTSRVIARRNVARFDWATDNPGPQNTFAFYSTQDALAQNNIAIDGDTSVFWQAAEDAGEFGCPVTQGSSSVIFVRNIQLNSEKIWGNMDDQSAGKCDAQLRNNLSWDVRPFNGHVAARGVVDIDHMTIGDIQMESPSAWLVNGFPLNTRGFRNSIIHNTNAENLFYDFISGVTEPVFGKTYTRTGISHLNISAATLTQRDIDRNLIDLDTISDFSPLYSVNNPNGSLRYLVRVERNSQLSGLGSDNQNLGAHIMTMRGASGTLWGESGYHGETNRPAWPFPLQEIIQNKMAAMNYSGDFYAGTGPNRRRIGTANLSGQRGFAAPGRDLTHYIWGYLGNQVPPMNVSVQSDGQRAIVRWDPPPPAYRNGIIGYQVYDFNPSSGELSNPRSAPANSNSFTVANTSNTHFAVTAIHAQQPETGVSYPTILTEASAIDEPNTEPADPTPPVTVLPPTLRVLEVIDSNPI